MTASQEIKGDITRAAEAIGAGKQSLESKRFLIGFDGFVDEIIHAVDTRSDKDSFERIKTIGEFGSRISSAAGKSANIELVPQQEKIGGNGPLMAMAVAGMGCQVTCMGLMGYPDLVPVFKPLQQLCRVISIGNPGHTDALEFHDGKIMLGKLNTIKDMCWSRLVEVCGRENLILAFTQSDMVGCTNWTMLTEMGEILENIIRLVPADAGVRFFFDLADPEKRSHDDLKAVLRQIQALDGNAKCMLGLNLREAEQISLILGIDEVPENSSSGVASAAARIRDKMNIWGVVVHAVRFAGSATGKECAGIEGPYCAQPKLSTGAGDHFNGGFCSGILAGLKLKDALYMGVGASGWYVRNCRSPQIDDVVELLHSWAAGNLLS